MLIHVLSDSGRGGNHRIFMISIRKALYCWYSFEVWPRNRNPGICGVPFWERKQCHWSINESERKFHSKLSTLGTHRSTFSVFAQPKDKSAVGFKQAESLITVAFFGWLFSLAHVSRCPLPWLTRVRKLSTFGSDSCPTVDDDEKSDRINTFTARKSTALIKKMFLSITRTG